MNKTSFIVVVIVLVIALYFVISSNPLGDFNKNNDMRDRTLFVSENADTQIPKFLLKSFPYTDWSKFDPDIYKALGGGPAKDGIPAIDEPEFDSLKDTDYPDGAQAVVVKSGDGIKVYPYNILVWHEIVNDTVDGVPMAITFCPLCGSAIVYNRTLPEGVTTFGVSGSLIESNMVMYDRDTESLWQQSTGKALAGQYLGEKLKLEHFQLLTMGEIRAKYSDAEVLSTNTGYIRDYKRAPYGGYNESDDFIFSPSVRDERYPPKKIFVVFRVGEDPVAVPWLELEEGRVYNTTVDDTKISIVKERGEITILDDTNASIPFYFEMWFSFAVQNPDAGIVFDPSKN